MALDCLSLILGDASSPSLGNGFVFGFSSWDVDAHPGLSNIFRLCGVLLHVGHSGYVGRWGFFCQFCPPFSVSFSVLDSFYKNGLSPCNMRIELFICVKAIRQQLLKNIEHRNFWCGWRCVQ